MNVWMTAMFQTLKVRRAKGARLLPLVCSMLLFMIAAQACGSGDSPSQPPAVASVAITTPSNAIIAGSSQQLHAVLKANDGTVLSDRSVAWTSSNVAVAKISSDGVLDAVSPGAAAISASSGGQTGTIGITVAPIPVAKVTLDPATVGSMFVGQTFKFGATVQDANGVTLTGRIITWTSDNTAIATVDGNGVVTGIGAGTANITATSELKSASTSVVFVRSPVATVAVTLSSSALFAGTTTQAVASLTDANGNPAAQAVVAWTSSDIRVATVSTSGIVTAIAPGVAVISATSDGKAGSATLAVSLAPVATISLSPATAIVVAGATQQLTVSLRDTQGNTLSGRIISWTSSNNSVATVNATGLVTTVAGGVVTITATSESKAATATITVASTATSPIVTSVLPGTLTPGATATISGLQFDTASSRNTVTIRGVNAPVVSSSPTQLTVTVPCVSSGAASVVVTSGGNLSPSFTQTVAVTARTLGVGQSLVLTNSASSLCNELTTSDANARYIIAVFSAATSQNTLVNFEIAGNTAASVAAERVIAPRLNKVGNDFTGTSGMSAQDAEHFRMLERDRKQYEQSRSRAAQLSRTTATSALRASASRASALRASAAPLTAPLPAVGDLRDFFYTYNGGCQDVSSTMHTRAIYVGTRAIIWEDATNVLQSRDDPAYLAFYQRLGQIFDQDQYAIIRDNFGDPLLRDALTDADGRIHMVFSQKLNGSGAAAFVTSCDQYPRTVNAGSNFGEVFYGQVPTLTGSNLNSTTYPDGWFYFMGRTVVHEVKHIASQSARVANNAPSLEQSWLEEGTARHAEELWVREYVHHVPWKGNTGYGTAATNGIYCDFQPTDATCNAADPLRRPTYGMRRQFNEIRDKLLSPWDWSPYGDATSQTGSVFYQTSWSLVRYTIDRYATSEPAFFKALINSSTNGVTNLTTVAGASLDQLIGGWGLALFADDYPGLPPSNPDLQFQTWNLRSIYAGLNASPNWNSRFPTAFPIAPVQLNFGSFVSPRTGLRGGAHSYYELSGPTVSNQLIQLRGTGGTTPSTNLRIAIARLQ